MVHLVYAQKRWTMRTRSHHVTTGFTLPDVNGYPGSKILCTERDQEHDQRRDYPAQWKFSDMGESSNSAKAGWRIPKACQECRKRKIRCNGLNP